MTVKTRTAAEVRAYFQADEKRMARLSPEAAKTVSPGARGRLSPEAVKVHNRFSKVKYVLGTTSATTKARQAEVAALREKARAAGIEVKDRGRLPKAVLAL